MKILGNLNRLTVLVSFVGIGLLLAMLAQAEQGSVAVDSSRFDVISPASTVLDQSASGDSHILFGVQSLEERIQEVKNEGIVAIGDSLMHQIGDGGGTAQLLQQSLVSDGWQGVTINAQGCRATGQPNACFAPQVLGLIEVLGIVQSGFYDGTSNSSNIGDINAGLRDGGTVVVGLGVNDQPHDTFQMEQKVRGAVGLLRSINESIDIHWVKVCSLQKGFGSGTAMNAALDRVHDELDIELIDWNSQCRAEYLFDGVHYNQTGAQAYVNAIAEGVIPTPDEFD